MFFSRTQPSLFMSFMQKPVNCKLEAVNVCPFSYHLTAQKEAALDK